MVSVILKSTFLTISLELYLWHDAADEARYADIQCGSYKFCEGTSGFCYYSKVRKILGFPFNCQRFYNINANTPLSAII